MQSVLLSAALNAEGIGVWHFDRPTRLVTISDGLLQMLQPAGVKTLELSLDELLNNRRIRLLDSELYAKIRRSVRGFGGWKHEISLISNFSDQPLWLKVFGKPVHSESGYLTGFEGGVVNITDHKLLNQKLSKTIQPIEGVHEADSLQHVTALLAHEISNMIQPAISFGDLGVAAVEKGDVEAAKLYLNDAIDAMVRVDTLVKNALPGSIETSSDLNDLSVQDIIEKVKHVINPAMRERLTIDCQHQTAEARVRVSSVGIVQVFLNLIRNAYEASGGDKPIFILMNTIDSIGERPRRLVVNVLDKGPGFPEEAIENVLDPFFSTKMKKSGSGLGLSVVKTLIETWGGQVDVSNVSTGGAMVRFELPIIIHEDE